MSKYVIFVTISLGLLLSAISGTAIAVAFPVITTSLDASLITAGWVLSIYQLIATAAMPLAGKASDVFGRKSTFLACLLLFTTGSLLCAIAPNVQLLIFFRLIQGIGGGGLLPAAAGIAADEFPNSRQQAIGLFSSIYPAGQIIGPNLGGWLTQAFGWRSIFWFNIPLGVAAIIVAIFMLKSGKRTESHIDLTGAGLFAGSIFALMVSLSEMGSNQGGLSWGLAGLLLAAGVALMIAFIRHIGRVKNPIIDPQVLKKRPFMAANIYNFMFGAASFGVSAFVPLYAVSIYNMSILESGFILTPRSVASLVASAVTSFFLMRWGYRKPMLVGTAATIVSLFLLGLESPGVDILGIHLGSTALLGITMLIAGFGVGVAAPAANNACIELMPDHVASITGVRGMFRQSGGAVGIAITSLLLHNFNDMARGFTVVFIGLSVITLFISPIIFAMPKAPGVVPLPKSVDSTQ
ncbi:MAG: MFS transporter [Chloroflexota bacterium]|nr:MFS transporter [Chloroflexota bacterium]